MNWEDGTNADTSAASRERSGDDTGVLRDTPAETWSPYEVWRTRIKQPRERAARVEAIGNSSDAISAGEIAPVR